MQGTIAFDGTLSGSIAGGGGGGSEVTITPTLTEGEKIADFEIDGTQGELYAPTPTPLPEHIVNDIHGFSYTPYPSTEIARYTIDDGEEQSIYAPDYETTWEAYPGVDQDYTIGILRCYGSTYNVKIPNYQKPLTAGANISIDPDTNVISASGGSSWDYSTTEVNTGQKWIDGVHDIYNIVIAYSSALALNSWVKVASFTDENIIPLEACAINTNDANLIQVSADFDINDGLYVNNRVIASYTPSHIICKYVKLS